MRSELILRYKRIIHGVQALRRWAELQQCPVLGAAGVRAFCYPHQLYVVRKVLEATQIRHLLADEVGLGKTLEALMIMHALRIRNGGKLRVSIVVGSEERAKQWRDEIFGRFPFTFWKEKVFEKYPRLRCNGNVFFDDKELDRPQTAEFAEDGYHLIISQNFDANKKYLEPEHCDLLILDEIHSFSDALLAFLASRSAAFPAMLVLSATPLLGAAKDRMQLLKLIAPEEAEQFDIDGTTAGIEKIPCLQEKMLRSRRLDFPKSLPQRKAEIIRIEPFENDMVRFEKSRTLMQKFLRGNLINEDNAVLFIRRSVIGGQTLSDRIGDYRRRYPEYAEELTELQTLCSIEQGDARFDALVDYLLPFFAEDNEERKLIIAAQDMPTVYYLQRRLQHCFPDIGILIFKQERNRSTEDDNELEEQNDDNDKITEQDNKGIVEQFWTSDAQILIAHNDAREAFNLQIADALIFYSLPWNPVDMEQWLGRVSRLGLRKKKTVEIVALVLRDLLDEQIVDLYLSLDMFEKPLDIEQNQNIFKDITQQICQTVLYGNVQIDTSNIKSDEWNETLMHIVPRKEAVDLDKKTQSTVANPSFQSAKVTDYPKEDALNGWLEILQQHEFCHIKTSSDDNYQNSEHPWYYQFKVIDKHRNCSLPIPVLNGEPISKIPFIVKRSHIQLPPRDFVPIIEYNGNSQRYEVPLQFFNFGSPLHDELIKTFAVVFNTPKLFLFRVKYHSSHVHDAESGIYRVGILTTQRKRFEHKKLFEGLPPKNDNKTQDEMRQSEQRRLETGLQADDRFLDLLMPGGLEICRYTVKDKQAVKVDPKDVYDFLRGIPDDFTEIQQPKNIPENVKNQLVGLAQETTRHRWQKNFQPLLERRIAVLRQELLVRERLLKRKIEIEQQKIETDENDWNIRMTYVPNKKRYEEQLQLIRKHCTIRERYLTDSIEAASSPVCICQSIIFLQVNII